MQAGTTALAWDEVTECIDQNNQPFPCTVDSYSIAYGTAARDPAAVPPNGYSQEIDVGNVTNYEFTTLPDCTDHYFGVAAYRAGEYSTEWSNEVVGFNRPEVAALDITEWERGYAYTVTVTGNNYKSGANVFTGSADVAVTSVFVSACGQLSVDVSIAPGATLGSYFLEVRNPDGTFGELLDAFTIIKKTPGPALDLRRTELR